LYSASFVLHDAQSYHQTAANKWYNSQTTLNFCALSRNRKDSLVSENRPSDQIQIPGSLAIFLILLLGLGIVLLSTSNISPESTIRASSSLTPAPSATAAPTVNAFSFAGYRPFASPDGVVKLEFPDGWNYIPSTQVAHSYVFSPDQTGASSVAIQIRVIPRSDLVAGMAGITAQSSPKEILTSAFGQVGGTPQKIDDAKAGSLSGARTVQANAPDDKGEPSGKALDTVLLALDNQNFVLIQAVSPTGASAQIKPILDKVLDTLQVDTARLAGPASPGVTSATQAATQAATAATQVATAQK
jgi:hypothetical protein